MAASGIALVRKLPAGICRRGISPSASRSRLAVRRGPKDDSTGSE